MCFCVYVNCLSCMMSMCVYLCVRLCFYVCEWVCLCVRVYGCVFVWVCVRKSVCFVCDVQLLSFSDFKWAKTNKAIEWPWSGLLVRSLLRRGRGLVPKQIHSQATSFSLPSLLHLPGKQSVGSENRSSNSGCLSFGQKERSSPRPALALEGPALSSGQEEVRWP